jgi:hypothetical protein
MKIVLVILVILILFLIILNSIKIKEKYDNMANINTFLSCGRNLVFPYYTNLNKPISKRSLVDNKIISKISGNCFYANDNVDDANLALVSEDFINHYFKKSCYTLKFSSFKINKTEILITFDTKLFNDKENMLNFLLLNPVFIEFVYQDSVSQSYLITPPQPSDSISFDSFMDKLTLKFNRITNNHDSIIFNFANKIIDDNYFKNKNTFSVWVYYTDKIKAESNYLNMSNLTVNKWDVYKYVNIYDEGSQSLFESSIVKFYNNNITPVFTTSMVIDLNEKPESKLIAKMFVDNGYYVAGKDNCDNNIFSIMFDDKSSTLYLISGDRKDCGYANGISFKVPLTSVNVNFSIGPNQRNAYIYWNDKNLNKQFIYLKKWKCLNITGKQYSVNSDNNDFNTIFTSTNKDLYPLNGIKLVFSSDVKTIDKFELGYSTFN